MARKSPMLDRARHVLAPAAFVLSALGSPAFAHTGHETGFSLVDGALHPLSGMDHVAAMVAVGLWATLAGGRRIWVWPLAFVAAMLAGGLLGRLGMAVPLIEPAIAASVLVLGLIVAAGVVMPLVPGALLIGTFAIFHGLAHGLEAPATGWAGYAAGFALATSALHAVGIGGGMLLRAQAARLPERVLGVAAAALGLALIAR